MAKREREEGKRGMMTAVECCFLPINNFEALFPFSLLVLFVTEGKMSVSEEVSVRLAAGE
jgi:hypothetical protein